MRNLMPPIPSYITHKNWPDVLWNSLGMVTFILQGFSIQKANLLVLITYLFLTTCHVWNNKHSSLEKHKSEWRHCLYKYWCGLNKLHNFSILRMNVEMFKCIHLRWQWSWRRLISLRNISEWRWRSSCWASQRFEVRVWCTGLLRETVELG